MPGHILPAGELRAAVLSATEIAIAHAAQDIRERAEILAPKHTDALAADIKANRTRRSGNSVSSRIHTSSEDGYGVYQETKDEYHHRVGEARFMRNALLSKATELGPEVAAAVKEVTG